MSEDEINALPYAEWLELSIQSIARGTPVSLGFVAIMEDGDVWTGYWNADCSDKAVMASNIQADSVWQMLEANTDRLREMLDEEPDA